MIIPHHRLLFWVGITLSFTVIWPFAPVLSACAVVLFCIVTVMDALIAYQSCKGISLTLPGIVQLAKDREGSILLQIQNERKKRKHVGIGIPFPLEIETPQPIFWTLLPEKNIHSHVPCPCTPRKRGCYHIKQCYFEVVSPLGLWAARGSSEINMEIRVYPNLLKERHKFSTLFLRRENAGVHTQRMIGHGHEFEKLREYIPGDNYDDIHWKATAKRGHPITKVFQIERTQEVYVLLDASRLSAKQLDSENVLEQFIISALLFGLVTERQEDLFGLLTFSNQVKKFLRAKNGKAHHAACRDLLYTLEPELVTPDFDDLFTFVRLNLRRRALLIFLTDLNDPVIAESFFRNIELICRQHLVFVNMIKPIHANPLFSGLTAHDVDDLYQFLGGHFLWHHLKELEKKLKHKGVTLSLLDPDRLTASLMNQYLDVKHRQIL